MIDLDALRKCRRVTWKLARQNLALLDHFFWLRCTRTDRYRFLKTYLEAGRKAADRVRRFARGSRTRPGSGPSGSGGGGAAAAGRRTSISRSFGRDELVRGIARPGPGEIPPLLGDPDLPFNEPVDDRS